MMASSAAFALAVTFGVMAALAFLKLMVYDTDEIAFATGLFILCTAASVIAWAWLEAAGM